MTKKNKSFFIKSLSIITFLSIFASGLYILNNTKNQVFANYSSQTNLDTIISSYISSPENDKTVATGIFNTKEVVYLINTSGNPGNLTNTTNIDGGGNILLVKINPLSKVITSSIRLPGNGYDLDISKTNNLLTVATSKGAYIFDNQLALLGKFSLASEYLPTTDENSNRISTNGNVTAYLSNKKVYLLNQTGQKISEYQISGTYVNDIAVNNNRFFVTGYSQKDGGGCTVLQVAFVRGYNLTNGNLDWTGYDWTHSQAYSNNSSCADSRSYVLDIGEDGKLYFAAESAGGNSIFRYQSKSLTTNANNVGYDKYNQAFQTKSEHITYYARLNPENGDQILGQFQLARKNSFTDGNTIRPRAITADSQGRVFVGGVSAARFAGRNNETTIANLISINNQLIGDYAGNEAYLLILNQDFSTREFMGTWTKSGSSQNTLINSIDTYSGLNSASFDLLSSGISLITNEPLTGNTLGNFDGFISIWGDVTGASGGGTTQTNQKPTANLTSPTNNQVFTAPANINLTATANDADGTVSKVEFYLTNSSGQSAKLGEDTTAPYTFAWNSVTAGSYTLRARSYDDKNEFTDSSNIVITVNNENPVIPNQPPTVSITSPTNGSSVSNTSPLIIQASANDTDGTVSKVEFYLTNSSGTTKLGEDTTAPYSFTWNSPLSGSQSLTARAYDNLNMMTTSMPISVNITAGSTGGGNSTNVTTLMLGRNFVYNQANNSMVENSTGVSNFTQINCSQTTFGNTSIRDYQDLCNQVKTEAGNSPIYSYFFRYQVNCGQIRSGYPQNLALTGFFNFAKVSCDQRGLSNTQNLVLQYMYFTYRNSSNQFVPWFAPKARDGIIPLGWNIWGE